MLKKLAIVSAAGLLLILSGCSANQNKARGQKINLSAANTTVLYFGSQAELKVTDLTLDFFPNANVLKDPKSEGKQFVRLNISLTNTGTEDFPLNFTSLFLKSSKEAKVMETFMINDSNSQDHLPSKTLAKGETVSGALYFEVDAAETKDTLSLVYRGYDKDYVDYSVNLSK
jgi:hypothetical protein